MTEKEQESTPEQKLAFEEKLKASMEVIAKQKEQEINPNAISIEGIINWRLVVDTETKHTQVAYNASVSNEGAVLALSQQIINSIITHAENNGANSKETQRLRIAKFELQKLFGRCLTYILDNRDKELAPKEDVK